MKYEKLNADDLRGATLADYLVNLEADLDILDGDETIYSELAFPVAELARALTQWIRASEEEALDFHFDSLSFPESGAIRILRSQKGWSVGSALTPEKVTAPQSWAHLVAVIEEFTGDVRRDVRELGLGPDFVVPTRALGA